MERERVWREEITSLLYLGWRFEKRLEAVQEERGAG
jgi:hypothetical protein